MVTLFFDLDGVLADFVGGALRVHGAELARESVTWGFPLQIGFTGVDDPRFWAPFGFDYWSNLEPYADGFALLAAARFMLGVERIGLLTSPCDTAGCVDGKRKWVARHLPDYRRRLFVGSAKELFAGPTKILIDDHDPNCSKFTAAGGHAITPPRPWNDGAKHCVEGDRFDVPSVVKRLAETIEIARTR